MALGQVSSELFSFSCQHHSTNAPHSCFIHVPPILLTDSVVKMLKKRENWVLRRIPRAKTEAITGACIKLRNNKLLHLYRSHTCNIGESFKEDEMGRARCMHTRSENCNILVCKVEQNCHLIAIYGDKTRIGLKDVRVCV